MKCAAIINPNAAKLNFSGVKLSLINIRKQGFPIKLENKAATSYFL